MILIRSSLSGVRLYRVIHLFWVLLMLSGCASLSTITFDEVVPATTYIDSKVANVTLVNLAPIQRSPSYFIVVKNKVPVEVDSVWFDDFNRVVLDRFYSDLVGRQFFDSVRVDTIDYHTYGKYLQDRSLKSILDSICVSTNTDGIFFISQCNYSSTLFIEPVYDNQFWGYLEARGVARLGFYNHGNQSFDDTCLFEDSLFINGASGTITEFNSNLPSPTSLISSVGDKMGHQFTNRYVPYWHSVERSIFKGGNYFFILGGNAIDVQNWDSAIQSYHFAIDKGGKHTKARASYNLAVMAEMKGDIASALAWLNSSINIYNSFKWKNRLELEMAQAYLEVLKIRQVEVYKLTQQISNK